jgi:bacterioferritin
MAALDKDKVVGLLNQILEQELAGVVRYTHYHYLGRNENSAINSVACE